MPRSLAPSRPNELSLSSICASGPLGGGRSIPEHHLKMRGSDPPQARLERLPSGRELVGCLALEWVEVDEDILVGTSRTAVMEEMNSLDPQRFAIRLHVLGLLLDKVLSVKGAFAVRAFSPHESLLEKNSVTAQLNARMSSSSRVQEIK